jgi:hypothetical protein
VRYEERGQGYRDVEKVGNPWCRHYSCATVLHRVMAFKNMKIMFAASPAMVPIL